MSSQCCCLVLVGIETLIFLRRALKKKKSVCLAKSTQGLKKRVEKGDKSVVLSLLLVEARAGPLLPDLEG